MVFCEVCHRNNNAAYKCPTCRILYCTVSCFKLHKDTKCERLADSEAEKQKERENSGYTTEDTVPLEKLELLDTCVELKEILANKHVRDILVALDSCAKPNEQLERAMQEPLFVEFADACLRVIEDRQNETT